MGLRRVAGGEGRAGSYRLLVSASETGMRFESRVVRVWGIALPLRTDAWARGCGSSWEVEVTLEHVGSYRGVVAPAI